MNTIRKMTCTALAAAGLIAAATSAQAFTVYPDFDFEWYAQVGKPAPATVEVFPAPREGYIWSPGHWERRGARNEFVSGHWIADDYRRQVEIYSSPARYGDAAPILDTQGNPIPLNPEAYPVDSATR